MKQIFDIEFNDLIELLEYVIRSINDISGGERESVVVYADSDTMFRILRLLFSHQEFSNIKIGHISVVADWFDKNEKNDYVFEINEKREVSVQSAWGNSALLECEAKHVICVGSACKGEIIEALIDRNTSIVVADVLKK